LGSILGAEDGLLVALRVHADFALLASWDLELATEDGGLVKASDALAVGVVGVVSDELVLRGGFVHAIELVLGRGDESRGLRGADREEVAANDREVG
jgi:hypothetical protein